jgi:hypothetical protein
MGEDNRSFRGADDLVSLTGMVLILFLYKRRLSGLLVLGSGVVIFILVYRFWVP